MNKNLLAFLVLAMVGVSSVWAQPLAEHVPGDAMVYVGWRGADDLGDGYDGSNLKALREATELPEALSQTLDVIERANAHNQEVAMVVGLIRTIGQSSWRHPTAMYLQPTPNPDVPARCVVLWRVQGEPGDALQAQLIQMVQEINHNAPADDMLHVERTDALVSLTIGELPEAGEPAEAVASTLADNPDFRLTVSRVNADGVLVVYADGRGLLSMIDKSVARTGSPQEREMWPKVRDALGLAGLNAAAWSAGFDGKDWRSDLFVDAPAPRVGVLSLLDGDPITDDELGAVPVEATWMLAARFDLGALLDSVRQVVAEIDPQISPKLEDALMQGNRMTGIDIEADLIRSLGSAWIAYTDPGATGSGMMGVCLVNELKDAEKVGRALTALQALANAMMGQMMGGGRGGGPDFQVRFRTITDHDMTLHSLGIPFVAPTWSVHEGRLYVGLYPQTVLTAGDRIRADRGSILTNERFQAVRARLDASNASSIVFADLPRTAEDSYPNLVMMSQMGTGFLAMFGSDTMPMLLPPFSRIESYLAPAGQTCWSDDSGFHARSISPFPGAMMLGPQGGTNATMSAPMMAGILLPALGAARRTARQVQSMSNARQILVSLFTYATDHKDQFPEDITAPLEMGYVNDPNVYFTPASGKQTPPGFKTLPKEQRTAWLRQNTSYILIPMPKWSEIKNASGTICLFELPEDASNIEALIVGFADGHAQSMPIWEVEAVIMEQTGKTMEELAVQQRNYQPPME